MVRNRAQRIRVLVVLVRGHVSSDYVDSSFLSTKPGDGQSYRFCPRTFCCHLHRRLLFEADDPAGALDLRQATPTETTEVILYKRLGQIERAFRSFKTMDLHVRAIFHRTESCVRAHILLCMLAYYVQWHMLDAWRSLLFCDEDVAAKATRDPVAPAKRSAEANRKAASKRTADGSPVHRFQSLLQDLNTIVRNTYRRPVAKDDEATVDADTRPSETQQRALDLIASITL